MTVANWSGDRGFATAGSRAPGAFRGAAFATADGLRVDTGDFVVFLVVVVAMQVPFR
jgi:hypothetical protein